VAITSIFYIKQGMYQFETQKIYFETHIPKNNIEDAALTQKKIELNSWLNDAQYSKNTFSWWSLYPESIMDLTAIE
jgi:hypothetical protein